jgi:hypothetical protein
VQGDYLRWLYRTGRPNAFARWQNALSVRLTRLGVGPTRLVTLQVRGRRTGRLISFPLVLTEVDGKSYLVAMLGAGTNWVRNLQATGGEATLVRHRRSRRVHLELVPVQERAAVIQRFLALAPGARPHLRLDRDAPTPEWHAVNGDIPVFAITAVDGF